MSFLNEYEVELKQLKELRQFAESFENSGFTMKNLVQTINSKITLTEDTLHSFTRKTPEHRCGLCDRPYDEEVPVMIDALKVCPTCRQLPLKYQAASVWEDQYDLADGTIKRDCYAPEGQSAKLQVFLDANLIYKTGHIYMVHEKVIHMYYNNPTLFRRRKRKNKQ